MSLGVLPSFESANGSSLSFMLAFRFRIDLASFRNTFYSRHQIGVV